MPRQAGAQDDGTQPGRRVRCAALLDHAAHATAAAVRHQDDRARTGPPGGPAQRVHAAPGGRQRVGGDVRRD